MPLSNYPNGFLNGVTIRGMPILNTYSGNVYYVNSATGSNGNPGTINEPYASINGAIAGGVTASNGDIVLCMPGHAETLAAATEVALSKAGMAIIGLGMGSLRPTLTFTAVASNIPVTASNITMKNFLMISTRVTAFTTSAFTTTGTAISNELTLDSIEFRDSSSTTGFLAGYTSNATADSWNGFTMNSCQFNSGGGVLTRKAVNAVVGADRFTFTNNSGASLQTTVAMMVTAAAVNLTNCDIGYNRFEGAHTSSSAACGISGTGTAWSGTAYNNYIFSLASGTGIWIPTTTKLALFQNYSPIAGAYATQGTLNPIAS